MTIKIKSLLKPSHKLAQCFMQHLKEAKSINGELWFCKTVNSIAR